MALIENSYLAPEIILDDLRIKAAADPDRLAEEQVQGMIEHFNAFIEGHEESFFKLFVNGDAHHTRQHRHFVRLLGLEMETRNIEPIIVLKVGQVSLIQEVEYSAEQAPFGVSYTAYRE